ncbi:bidirectional sugar transporter SWEET5-like [Silene latifolia]|uniref:bidirectional sugar transporter SWEET5-like n=1 Tax=Silene latifolia TaxID=37657 RepID=UPI003D77EAE5
MDGWSIAELIMGILGNITSTFLFLSPISTCKEIHKKKSIGQFSPLIYLAMVLNCGLWLAYGLFLNGSNRLFVLTTNGLGLFLSLIYTIFFAYYADKENRKRILVLLFIVLEIVILACVVTSIVLVFFTSKNLRKHRGSVILGSLGVMANLFLYASPLSIAKKVIKTKNVEYWPCSTSLASFLNGLVWTIYATCPRNTFILIPNILGCMLGLIQLIIYAKFKNNAIDLESDPEMSITDDNANAHEVEDPKSPTSLQLTINV